jgi:ATP-dependent DNA helicase RecG
MYYRRLRYRLPAVMKITSLRDLLRTCPSAEYSKNKAFEKQQYFDWILKSIQEHGSLSRKDVDELLWNMLPAWMNYDQKKNRIDNLIRELRTNGKIVNNGNYSHSIWQLKV